MDLDYTQPINGHVICGITPGNSGTGRFFQALLPYAHYHGYTVIYPRTGPAFTKLEQKDIDSISNSKVLLLHPQTIGLKTILGLLKRENSISFYVLDNSFFCIRSYNHRPDQIGECFDCMYNLDKCHSSCTPFPIAYEKNENIEFLKTFKTFSSSIRFLCQSETQEHLLKRYFGQSISSSVIGMRTDEYTESDVAEPEKKYDMVFHADAIAAKGINYTLRLAETLPEFSFLIPADKEYFEKCKVEQNYDVSTELPNVTFDPMRWNNGLHNHVQHCKLVLCPSVWSAPVEGALMKSLYYSGSVAVVDTRFGFQREIPSHLILRLSDHLPSAANQIREYLKNPSSNKEEARKFVMDWNERCDLNRIFSES